MLQIGSVELLRGISLKAYGEHIVTQYHFHYRKCEVNFERFALWHTFLGNGMCSTIDVFELKYFVGSDHRAPDGPVLVVECLVSPVRAKYILQLQSSCYGIIPSV